MCTQAKGEGEGEGGREGRGGGWEEGREGGRVNIPSTSCDIPTVWSSE